MIEYLNDRIKERLKFEIEVFKLLVVFFISVIGGVITLILKDGQVAKDNLMIAVGLVLIVVCIRFIFLRYKGIKNTIDNGLQ